MYQQVTLIGNNSVQKAIILDTTTTYTDGYNRIIINQYNHNLVVGTEINIKNAIGTTYIPNTALNGNFIIETVIDTNHYTVKLPLYNNTLNGTNTGGGNTILITFPISFRLRMDYATNIGQLLGFRNVGQTNSITPFSQTIKNNQPYENDFLYNTTGQSIVTDNGTLLTPRINLSGDNYILMVNPLIDTSINIGPVTNVLAKIGLYGPVGTTVFNSYTMLARDFDTDITSISTLQFQFYLPDGTLYNFNGMDHAFTLEIVEDLNELINSYENTRTGLQSNE